LVNTLKTPKPGDGCDCGCGTSQDFALAKSRRSKHRFVFIVAVGAVVVLVVWLFREPLRQLITREATLANDAPTQEAVGDMIEHATDQRAALLAAWNSGKIVHREVAIQSFAQVFPPEEPLPPEFDSLILSAALDPDMNVRELALTILQQRKHPALPELAAAQLRDCDQQVRLLGLSHLKSISPSIGVPTLIPLLDDPDPLIVTMSLKLLENWSGSNFGVKLSETVSFENEKTGLKEHREGSSEKARAGARRAKVWWLEHQTEFPPVPLRAPNEAHAARQPLPAGDFQLQTLEGQKLRLSNFRGKVVLVNFWTTWCPACVSEVPELIALLNQHKDNLVILGVSLDYVPDEHGHIGGHATVEEQGRGDGHQDDHERSAEALKRVREKVARTVKARGINYPILLDERNEVGGRYNGGELPTTVIVDAQGNVRRRFIGARSLPVFEAMITEAQHNQTLTQTTE
jgi:thiol-disulfide isomerase/thioredoxin